MSPTPQRSRGGTTMTETTVPDVGPPTKLGADHGEPSVSRVGILIGYARCSTERQDLTAQREILRGLGVAEDRIYLDHGLTGRNRSRPGLNSALAAAREGDTLVVPKLDRLARSVPDARAIGDSVAARGVRLSLGGSVYDPTDPMGKCFFNILGASKARPQTQPDQARSPAQAPRRRRPHDRRTRRALLSQPGHHLP
jgi:DNA invertase Pin-like site-specific DNA recombinase